MTDSTFDAPWHNDSWQIWQTDDGIWMGRIPGGPPEYEQFPSGEALLARVLEHREATAERRNRTRENALAVIDRAEAAGRKRVEAQALLADLGL